MADQINKPGVFSCVVIWSCLLRKWKLQPCLLFILELKISRKSNDNVKGSVWKGNLVSTHIWKQLLCVILLQLTSSQWAWFWTSILPTQQKHCEEYVNKIQAGETSWQLRVHTSLLQDLSSVPKWCNSSSRGCNNLFWPPWALAPLCTPTQIHHKNKINIS